MGSSCSADDQASKAPARSPWSLSTRAIRSWASASPGYRSSPPCATLYAASTCPRRRSASASSRNARLSGSSARRAVRLRMSSVTIALQLLHDRLHRLAQALHRRALRFLARGPGMEPAPRDPAVERLAVPPERGVADAEQPTGLRHQRVRAQQLLQRAGGQVVLTLRQGLPRGHQKRRQVATRLGLLRSEEHTSELQSPDHLVCRLLLE